jgi:hypothetical protein
VGDRIGAYGVWRGDLMERDDLEELDVNGRIILKWILKTWDGKAWTGWLCLMLDTDGGLL